MDEDVWEKVSMFGMTVTTSEESLGFPREGDEFTMQVILQAGYRTEDLWWINKVRVLLQVLFMLDILTASGNMISSEVLSPRPCGEARLTMRWPNEQPTTSDMDLWRNAMRAICPSRCLSQGIGRFIRQTHCIWK